MFKNTKTELVGIINADETKQDMRKKLLKFIEENPEMDQYIQYLRNANNVVCILLGFCIAIVVGELLLMGILLGDIL
jgi:hypothetical protein